ncbi:MAG: RDD family protein [Candidatus Korobacteraceae bacterium]
MTEQQLSQFDGPENAAEPAAEVWRNELQDRLARYKKRRGRRIEGAFTMRFPFPDDAGAEPVPPIYAEAKVTAGGATEFEEVAHVEVQGDEFDLLPASSGSETAGDFPLCEERGEDGELVLESVAAPEPEREPEPEPFVDTIVRPRPKRKVIAFPKHLSVAPETNYRLADPVTSEVPRILDVPEELEAIPTTPFLDGLQFELPNASDAAVDREHIELPFRAVTILRRILAGLLDLGVTGVGIAAFAAIAFKMLDSPPLTKSLLLGLAAAAVVLWSTYQYLFLVYAAKTMGMMAARIRLRTFKGRGPSLRQRRRRVLGFYLSALSLGMGLMWAFVDVDGLCWHDRLSETYLAGRE